MPDARVRQLDAGRSDAARARRRGVADRAHAGRSPRAAATQPRAGQRPARRGATRLEVAAAKGRPVAVDPAPRRHGVDLRPGGTAVRRRGDPRRGDVAHGDDRRYLRFPTLPSRRSSRRPSAAWPRPGPPTRPPTRSLTLPAHGERKGPLVASTTEGCQSGRMGRPRKPLWPPGHRGFESHTFRSAPQVRYDFRVTWSLGILVGSNCSVTPVPLAYHSQRSPGVTAGETGPSRTERAGAP